MKNYESEDDRELQNLLEKELKEGRLVNLVVDLLTGANDPQVRVNGVALPLVASWPTPSDKSCYKKCLKDSLGKPDPNAYYKECIKQCRPKLTLNLEILLF